MPKAKIDRQKVGKNVIRCLNGICRSAVEWAHTYISIAYTPYGKYHI